MAAAQRLDQWPTVDAGDGSLSLPLSPFIGIAGLALGLDALTAPRV
jgi:hypothetical protein